MSNLYKASPRGKKTCFAFRQAQINLQKSKQSREDLIKYLIKKQLWCFLLTRLACNKWTSYLHLHSNYACYSCINKRGCKIWFKRQRAQYKRALAKAKRKSWLNFVRTVKLNMEKQKRERLTTFIDRHFMPSLQLQKKHIPVSQYIKKPQKICLVLLILQSTQKHLNQEQNSHNVHVLYGVPLCPEEEMCFVLCLFTNCESFLIYEVTEFFSF